MDLHEENYLKNSLALSWLWLYNINERKIGACVMRHRKVRGVVIEFRFNPYHLLFESDLGKKYRFKNFPKHDEEFARIAFLSRVQYLNRERYHGWDIIWGVMSDNFPDQVAYDYMNGAITFDDAIEKLQKPNSMKQLYIGSQEICDMLELVNIHEFMANEAHKD